MRIGKEFRRPILLQISSCCCYFLSATERCIFFLSTRRFAYVGDGIFSIFVSACYSVVILKQKFFFGYSLDQLDRLFSFFEQVRF